MDSADSTEHQNLWCCMPPAILSPAALSEPGILDFANTATKFQIDWGKHVLVIFPALSLAILLVRIKCVLARFMFTVMAILPDMQMACVPAGTYKQSQFLDDQEHRLLTKYLDCGKNEAAKDAFLGSHGPDVRIWSLYMFVGTLLSTQLHRFSLCLMYFIAKSSTHVYR